MTVTENSPDPTREILAKRHRKSSPFVQIHRYTCLKTGQRLSGEGHNEADFWLFQDRLPNVRAIITELDSVVIGQHRYTADAALLLDDNRTVFIEVKSDQAAACPKFQRGFARKVDYFHAHGQELQLVRRSDFPGRMYMLNLKILHVYKTGAPPSDAELTALSALLAPKESKSFGDLCESLAGQEFTPHVLWFGLACGLLKTELNRRITDFSIIQRRKTL